MLDRWISWQGGENPVPGGLVVLRFRDGLVSKARRANGIRWEHVDSPDDVVAYLVMEEGSDDA